MNKAQVKRYVEQVFSSNAAPENYTNRDHCAECAEHDQTLRSYTPQSITLEQLGNPAWDPICFVLPQAFKGKVLNSCLPENCLSSLTRWRKINGFHKKNIFLCL